DHCDFYKPIYDATHDASVTVISISWGACEADQSSSFRQAVDGLFAVAGKPVFVASGDNGSADCFDGSTGVDFPASSPHVTGVGGTSLSLSAPSATWSSEVAWNGSGGGCSG